MKDKIEQIKSALRDPSCETVAINYWSNGQLRSANVPYRLRRVFSDEFAKSIKSFTVNHHQYPDIMEGDTVSCRDGIGVIDQFAGLYRYWVEGQDFSGEYHRHELVLLSGSGE